MATLIDIIDRAARDPEFLRKLRKDPVATARAEGYHGTPKQVAELLGIEGATDEEIVEAVQARLEPARKQNGGGSVVATAGVRG